jgi:histidinol-phosphatase (PHP family)
MIVDCHMHTPLCKHASGEPEEYVESAVRKGVDLITFTCHIPMANPDYNENVRMCAEELPTYTAMIEQAAVHGRRLGVEVLCGIEAEFYPDSGDMQQMEETLNSYPFDFVLGSIHHQVPIYRRRAEDHGFNDAQRIEDFFNQIAAAARSGRYDSISHPDVIKTHGGVKWFNPAEHEEAIRQALRAARESNTCIEVNSSGFHAPPAHRLYPDPLILQWAFEEGNRLTLGSDAHSPNRVGGGFEAVIPMLRQIGFKEIYFFRKRVCNPVDLQDMFHLPGVSC